MRADRWEKAAERETARRQRDAGPLFAPLVTPAEPAAVQSRAERMIAAQMKTIADGHAALEARGQEARATLAQHVSPEELARLDLARTWYPKSGEYTADHYGGECRKRGLPWPGQAEYEAAWAIVDKLAQAREERRAALAKAAGEQLDLPSGQRFAEMRARFATMTEEEQEAFETEVEAEIEAAEKARARKAP